MVLGTLPSIEAAEPRKDDNTLGQLTFSVLGSLFSVFHAVFKPFARSYFAYNALYNITIKRH